MVKICRFLLLFFGAVLLYGGVVRADVSDKVVTENYVAEYVAAKMRSSGQSDWNQTDSTAQNYIANKPENLESTINKTSVINEGSTDTQYPTARAVNIKLSGYVETAATANQEMQGNYIVTGSFMVPDQPLPTGD